MTSMISTQTASLPAAAGLPRERLLTGGLVRVLLSTFVTLTSFFVLMSVTPLYVRASGGGTSGAGLATGALLLSAVVAELVAPSLIRRYGGRMVLGLGAVLLGAPTLALLGSGQLVMVMAVSTLRGLGFGLTGVASGVLVAEVVPADRRGEGFGLDGIAASVPAIVALPGGVWLAGHAGYPVVIWIAAVTALCPLLVLPGLPGFARQPRLPGAPARQLRDALRDGGLRRPFLVFLAATMPAGIIASFLPLALAGSGNAASLGLLAQAVAATASRWWAGRVGDRYGQARLLIPGAIATAAGIAVLTWVDHPAAMLAGLCVFGAGFGILESATFTLMIERVPSSSSYGTVSALWNLAYDAGYGAGPILLGPAVGSIGYPACFAVTTLFACAALLPAWRDRAALPPAVEVLPEQREVGGAEAVGGGGGLMPVRVDEVRRADLVEGIALVGGQHERGRA
jgi:MFS family permease